MENKNREQKGEPIPMDFLQWYSGPGGCNQPVTGFPLDEESIKVINQVGNYLAAN